VLDLVAKKASSGDVGINLARQYLLRQEWGLAKMAVEDALTRGCLTEPDVAQLLLDEVHDRLGISRTGPVGGVL
jgi:hypothetical protein